MTWLSVAESEYISISALQHYQFCPRQCALIHLEQQWVENHLTVQGGILHEKVDSGVNESRNDIFTTRSLRISSDIYGLTGVADVVEFHRNDNGIEIPQKLGKWLPMPVEFKKGASKTDNCDRIQLCAQALCLEEMLKVMIPKAALWYNKTKSREWVDLSKNLREETSHIIASIHKLFQDKKTPKAIYEKKCDSCSLIEICSPKTMNDKTTRYYDNLFVSGDE